MVVRVEKDVFGKLEDGSVVERFTLFAASGIKAKVISYGATLVSLEVPGSNGKLQDVVCGYDDIEGYVGDGCYFGCTAGRFANRIAGGEFELDGVAYKLARNDGANHLHGGHKGFNKVLWDGTEFCDSHSAGVAFRYVSVDGEEGYPGNLDVVVTYTLTDVGELEISYEARTDKKTVVNLTNHSYFNLAGVGDVLSHELMINAASYTPVDEGLIPVGEVVSVKGSDLDFTLPCAIGERIANVEGGYDHNYVLNKVEPGELSLAARVFEPVSGRIMEVSTTEPGLQFYSGNFLDGVKGKAGAFYNKHDGFCLETQHWPDSPHWPSFPSVVLEPGQVYSHLTVHKFSVK